MSVVALQKSENIPQYSQCWKTITRVFKDDQKMKIHKTKQKEVNKMKKKWFILAVNSFEAEEFFKYGKEKLLEKSLKNISLETTTNMPVTSVPTNNELLNQL